MGDDWLKFEEALEYLNSQGYAWSRKTLMNKTCGQFAVIKKTTRGKQVFIRKADIDAFVRADSRTTTVTGMVR